jgi:hypothetical protein
VRSRYSREVFKAAKEVPVRVKTERMVLKCMAVIVCVRLCSKVVQSMMRMREEHKIELTVFIHLRGMIGTSWRS